MLTVAPAALAVLQWSHGLLTMEIIPDSCGPARTPCRFNGAMAC